jgi:hypothetical protein
MSGFKTAQSTSRRVQFQAFLASDHVTPATGKTIAITISKNGGAFGNPNAGATNATAVASGWYYVDLDTTDTNTLGPLAVRGAEGTIDDVGILYDVVKATNGGLTALPDAAAEAAGGLFTRGTGAGQINQPANGLIDANVTRFGGTAGTFASGRAEVNVSHWRGTAAVAPTTAGVPAVEMIDASAAGQTDIRAAVGLASANLDTQLDALPTAIEIRALASGTADSGTTLTMVDAARTEADTDYWKGNVIVFTSGNLAGQARLITGFTPGTDTITFSPATTQAVSTHTYEIWPAGRIDVAEIADAVWDEDATGHQMQGTFGQAIGDPGADTDTIWAKTNNLPAAPASTTDVSALLTTQLTEGYAADGAAPTLSQALMLIQQMLGEFSISGTTLTVKRLNGSTTAATFTLDSSTAPTSITRAS